MSRRGKVFQRTRGRGKPWSFVVDVGPDGGPREQMKRGGFATRDDAQEALTEVLASIQQGSYVKPKRTTFGAYLAEWLEGQVSQLRPTSFESSLSSATARLV